jgi:hypothetical protein
MKLWLEPMTEENHEKSRNNTGRFMGGGCVHWLILGEIMIGTYDWRKSRKISEQKMFYGEMAVFVN